MRRPILRLTVVLLVALLAGLLAACGGNGGDAASTPTLPPVTTAAVTLPPPVTLAPPTAMPITWTPRPTRTEPPRVTYEYTYVAPTLPSFVPPTYTPSPEPPTATPLGPVLILSPDVITLRVTAELLAGSGGFYESPPVIVFAGGQMIATWQVLTTPGDAATVRPVTIEINVELADGRIVLSKANAYFRDTTGAFTGELPDNLIGTLQTLVDTLVLESYTLADPENQRFYIGEIQVTDNGIRVQAVTLR